MKPYQKALADALREFSIREGDFTLASGKKSRWYVDARQLTFRGDCVETVGRSVVEALQGIEVAQFDSVGGLAIGADPVTMAVALVAGVRGFAVRKEAKSHGVAGRIAGPLQPGDRVVIVEDTVTTGGSALVAVDAVHEFGANVVAVSALLDRGGVLGAELERRGIAYAPVLGAPDLGYSFGE